MVPTPPDLLPAGPDDIEIVHPDFDAVPAEDENWHGPGEYEPIAIVGIGCRFPGAHGPMEYWEMLQKAEVQARPMPKEKDKRRWNNDHFYDPDPSAPGKIMHKTVCILDEVDKFDAEFFGLSNKEAAEMDPQHRILLETTYEALEDAGWSLKELTSPNKNVGVYVGAYAQDWSSMLTNPDEINNYSLVGRALFMISNRISHWFGLEGPSMTIDTACSSSMTAIHLACRALQQGECRVALASGANILLHPNSSLCLSRQGVFAKDGVLRAFDKRASGYVRGEGFGTLVLKPASQARADNDRIYAYVKGSVVHSGGKSKILTKPSRIAEGDMMVKALALAKVDRDAIKFVEAHGTGTPVGDAIELNAIMDAYRPEERSVDKAALKIGSVKSLIGHMEPASGVASIIKMALSLYYGSFTPNANFKEPNDAIANCKKLKVQTTVERVEQSSDEILVAVNSFGIGGTLAHCILQSGDTHVTWTKQMEDGMGKTSVAGWTLMPQDTSKGKLVFFPFSASSKIALKSQLTKWSEVIGKGVTNGGEVELENEFLVVDASLVALNLSKKRSHLPFRVLLRADCSAAFQESLFAAIESLDTMPKNALQRGSQTTRLLFTFPGQGPQCISMAKELYEKFPIFQYAVQKVDREFEFQTGESLIKKLDLFQSDSESPKASMLQDPKFCQSAIMMVQIGLVELLESFGVKPAATIGHSAGEVAACWASGLLSLSETVTVALARAATVAELHNTGGMLVLFADYKSVKELLDDFKSRSDESFFCEIAALNSNASTVLSGNAYSLNTMKEVADNAKIKAVLMRTTTPYHSSAIDPFRDVMMGKLKDLHPCLGVERPAIPFFSSTLGREFSTDQDKCGRDFWWTNVRHQVKFHETAKTMWTKSLSGDCSLDCVIEIANHPVLGSTLVDVFAEMNSSGNSEPSVLNPIYRNRPEHETFLDLLKKSYELGSDLNWDHMIPNCGLNQPLAGLRLPSYSWNHQASLWNEAKSCENMRHGESISSLSASSIQNLGGVFHISLDADTPLLDHVVDNEVVFPGAGYIVSALRCIDVTDGQVPGGVDLPSLVVSNVAFKNPLILSKESPTPVDLKWPKVGGDVSRFSFLNPTSSTPYCSGTVDIINSTATRLRFSALKPPAFDETSPDCVSKDSIYEGLKQRGLNYGPAFRNIIKARSSGGYAIGKLRGIPSNSRCFDISVLDSCFQLCILMVRDNGKAYIPYGLDRYTQIFQPSAYRELLVEAQVMEKQGGKIHFDIKIWETAAIGESSTPRLCAVCDKLIVSPLGDFEEASNLEFETVYQPVEVTDSEWKEVLNIPKTVRASVAQPESSSVDLDVLNAIQDWSKNRPKQPESDDDVKLNEPRVLYEEALLKAVEGDTAGSDVMTANNSSNDTSALEKFKFHADPQFEYDPATIELLMNHIRPMAASRKVLRVAVVVPQSDAALVEAFSDYFSASSEKPWWSNMEIVFFFCDGKQPVIHDEARKRLCAYGITSRGEAWPVLPPAIHSYDRADFQAVISTNVHRVGAASCDALLENIKELLVPGGLFVSLEVTHVTLAGLLSVAAHETWWSFGNLRPSQQSWLNNEQWNDCLNRSGFNGTVTNVQKTASYDLDMILGRVADNQDNKTTSRCAFATVAQAGGTTLGIINSIAEDFKAQGIEAGFVIDASSTDYHREQKMVMENEDNSLVLVVDQAFVDSHDPSTAIWKVMELLQPLSTEAGTKTTTKNGRVALLLIGQHPSFDGIVGLCRTLFYEKDFVLQVILVEHGEGPIPVDEISKVLSRSRYWPQAELRFESGQWVAPKIVAVDNTNMDQDASSAVDSNGILKDNPHWHLELPSNQEQASNNNIKAAFFGYGPQLGRKPPKSTVRIAVKAIGLQFKLAMIMLGMLPGYDMDKFSGGECSGIIEAVGDDEYAASLGLKVGDRVVACIGSSGVGTVMETPANWTCKLPEYMTFAEAATIPVCFLTAYQGLVKMARIEEDEHVLVHSAAGGVGLAAIQIVKMIGAIPIASVSSEEKKKFLRDKYDVTHFVQSRSLDFEEEVMAITKGRGVDVVLNSLAGEALKAGVRCLCSGGRFVEIGKVDILNKGKLPLDGFDANLSFLSCHIDKMLTSHPEKVGEALSDVMKLMETGKLHPLHHTVHPMTDPIPEVMRMTKGKHIGKIVFTLPDELDQIVPMLPLKPTVRRRLRPDATYFISGGLGSIGLALAEQMAAAGAKSLVLVGRRPPKTHWQNVSLARIRESGVAVHIEQVDIGDREAVGKLIKKYTTGDHWLRGIINVAGVTDDARFPEMSFEHVRNVMRPKGDATFNLHQATIELETDLDFFLMTSSLVGCIGNPGQTNYSAASLFLDGLMRLRHSQGLPASVLSIGAVEGEFGSGMIQSTNLIDTLSSRGMLFLSVDQAARAHLEMLKSDKWRRHEISARQAYRYSEAIHKITRRYTHLAAKGLKIESAAKKQGTSGSAKSVVRKKIIKELAGLLQMEDANIDPEMPIANYGIDSLGTVHLITFLKSEAKIVATQFDILGNATINSLLERLPADITPANVSADDDDDDESKSLAEGVEPVKDSTLNNSVDPSNETSIQADARVSAGDRLSTYSKLSQRGAASGRLKGKVQGTTTVKKNNPSVASHPVDGGYHDLEEDDGLDDDEASEDFGILGMEYFSSMHVVYQAEMEKMRGPAAAGYFTTGFGQHAIACMKDHTNIVSLALSALSKLFHTHGISPEQIGYLAVGTESNPDRSKSVKSALMTLFEESGNFNVEGVDHVAACYGGVAAMFDALAWMESSSWDGRLAVVVATDAALIEVPDDVFNGHGAFAVLLGPNAPVNVLSQRFSYHRNSWDFYVPAALNRFNPIVQFEESIECYLSSLEQCRNGICDMYGSEKIADIGRYMVLHGPNISMMRKGFRRILAVEENIHDKASRIGMERFEAMVGPSLTLVKNLGSLYTGSVFAGIYSLLYGNAKQVAGEKACVYAYGSGLGSTMFVLDVNPSWGNRAELKEKMLWTPLNERVEVTPKESQTLLAAIHKREKLTSLPFAPSCHDYIPGAWYLKSISTEASCEYHQPLPHKESTSATGLLEISPVPAAKQRKRRSRRTPISSPSLNSVQETPTKSLTQPFYYDPEHDPLLKEPSVVFKDLDGMNVYESDGFVVFVFARPRHKNTFNSATLKRFHDVLQEAGNRVVVLRGLGSSFCGGMDMSSDLMSSTNEVHRHINLFQDLLTLLANHAAPVIAACHGSCLAGGTGFAAVADVVISHQICRYGLPEIDHGLLPVVVSTFLLRRVQKRTITELALTGRELSAEEAVHIGMASYVTEDINDEVFRCVKKFTSLNGDLALFAKKNLPAPDIDSAKTLMALLLQNEEETTQKETDMDESSCTSKITPEGVAIISICSKDASVTPAVSAAFMRIVQNLAPSVKRGNVRAVILRGNCQHFCTGGDIAELAQWMAPNEMTTIARSYKLYVSFVRLRDLGVPVIVGFKGKVIGAGIGVGMLGDVRICTPSTVFDLAFFRHNISPGMATTATLADAVSSGTFLDMISGATVNAERALSCGIVQDIVEEDGLDEDLYKRALRFCQTDPRVVTRTMRLLRQPVDEVALLREAATQGTCFAELSRFVRGTDGEKLDVGMLDKQSSGKVPSRDPVTTSRPTEMEPKSSVALANKQGPLLACFGGFAMTQSDSDQLEVKRLHALIHANPHIQATVLQIAEQGDAIVARFERDELSFFAWILLIVAELIGGVRWFLSVLWGHPDERRSKKGLHAVLSSPIFDDSIELHPYHVASAMILAAVFNMVVLRHEMQIPFSEFKKQFTACCAFSFGQLAALTFAFSDSEDDMIDFVKSCALPLALEFVREFHHARPKEWSDQDTQTNLVVKNVSAADVKDAVEKLNDTLDRAESVHTSIFMTDTVTVVSGYPASLKKLKAKISSNTAQYSYLWLPTLPHTPYGESCISRLLSNPASKALDAKLKEASALSNTPILFSKDGPAYQLSLDTFLKSLFTEPVDWVSTSSIVQYEFKKAKMVYFGPGDDDSALAFKANLMNKTMYSAVTSLSPRTPGASRYVDSKDSLLSNQRIVNNAYSRPPQELQARSCSQRDDDISDEVPMEHRLVSTRESLQSGTIAAQARYPKKTVEWNVKVPAQHFEISKFQDYQEWRGNVQQASLVGLRFPYFVEHDSVIRGTTTIDGKVFTDYSAYNYLGLAGESEVNKAASNSIRTYGTSVSASRFASGERPIHRQLETELADFLGCEDSLVFSAGFLAIASAIVTLAKDKKDMVLYDSLSHRSAVEGVLASAGSSTIFPHNDCQYLDEFLTQHRHEYQRVIVVIEGAYSMDGDLPDLPAFCRLRKKHKFLLMVDEAHSLGVVGKTGRGLSEHFDVEVHDVDVWAGTLSKSLASCGGYLAGSREIVEYFKVFAPGFLFSAGITPANTAAALAALRKLVREPFRVTQLQSNTRFFLKEARSAGLSTMDSTGECAVIPVLIGDLFQALAVANKLYKENGIHVQPIGAPAVPKGSERLRFFISSMHTKEEIQRTVQCCAAAISSTSSSSSS